MPMNTNLNVSPYFDDYDQTKNYDRILFGSGRSIQARELNQLQDQLQMQIERLGRNLFEEGAMIIPGGMTVITNQNYATLTFITGSVYTDISGVSGLYITSNTTGLIAKVSELIAATGSDPATIFTDITNSGSGQQNAFVLGEACTVFTYNADGSRNNLALVNIGTIGQGQWVKIQSGVYFVRGDFVLTQDQSYVISKYTTNSTIRIGFDVSETIVTSATDTSLFSNANGFPNVNARGADRLQVELTLTGLAVGAVDANFIELARLESGVLQSAVTSTQYSIIEDAIAQRTFETNGNYNVVPFGLALSESLIVGNNGGMYTSANGGLESQFIASVKPGIAYVQGYRVDNIGIQNIAINKARDTAFLNDSVSSSDYGPYFLASSTLSLPDINITHEIQMLDSTSTMVGYCRVRAIRVDGSGGYRFYVFDLNFNTGKSVSNVVTLKYSDSSNLFSATLASSVLYNSNIDSLVFPLPVAGVKSLQINGISDTSYSVMRSFNLTTNSSGIATASVGANEVFPPVDPLTFFVTDTGPANAGGIYSASNITLTGTIVGTSLSINLGSGNAEKTIKLVAPVVKSAPTMKSKNLVTVTNEIVSFTDDTIQTLQNSDVYNLISVVDTTSLIDITSLFTLDNGMRDSWYQVGALSTVGSAVIERTVEVTYQYFSHTAGDYFCVDSYSGILRENMPVYNGVNLADVIDFRPTKDVNGNLTTVTVSGEIVKPADTIRADVTYYLPRNDIICVDENGNFLDVTGISNLSPTFPATPPNSMLLYQLSLPAYTEDVSQITIAQIANTVYTMKDIGALETRISNLEYYTTLSMLEATANNTQVLDPVTGNNSFKNGIAVDGFNSYSLCDMLNPSWSASLDLNANTCNPSFQENAVNLTTGTMSGVTFGSDVYVESFTEATLISQPYATTTININPYAIFSWIGSVSLSPNQDFWVDVTYLTPIVVNNTIDLQGPDINSSVWTGWHYTNGYAYGVLGHGPGYHSYNRADSLVTTTTTQSSTASSNTTNTVVNVSVIPYMRSINIAFTLTGFRPFTQLYPFWDSVNVSAFCEPTGGSYGGAIVTDAHGAATGIYTVPDDATNNFATGTSVFRFSDSSTNSTDPDIITTYGSTTFQSGGQLNTVQTLTTNTLTLTSTTTSSITETQYMDPIAQTFVIPVTGDAFVSSIDLFFATKALSVPVTVELRTTATGLPTNILVGSTTLNPSQVNVSTDGSVATRFHFADPIFMASGVQYALVVLANTEEYNVYIATQGENVIGSAMALSSQANVGVFLTSSNGSTWNPDQTTDIKFNVNQAVFGTSGGSVVFNSTAPIALPVTFNAITTTTGSSTVVLAMESHGLVVGDTATISGAIAGNNVLATDLNKTVTVTAATTDTFSFVVTTLANLTGTIGGSAIMVVANYPFSLFNGNANIYVPTGTNITWSYQFKSQSGRSMSGFIPFDINNDVYLPNEAVIQSAGDFQIMATYSSTISNLTPCIDFSGLGVVLISPRVNVTEQLFNYVTESILFNNPNTTATFYVAAQLPNQSNMTFYIKQIDSADQDLTTVPWVALTPTSPIVNSMNFIEYDYILKGNFVGYKVMISFTGNNCNIPIMSEFRSIAFA